MQGALTGIVFSNLLQTARFFMTRQHRHLTLEKISHLPFIRVFVQQLTVIAGGFVFFVMGYGVKGLAMLLILLKTFSDRLLLRSEEREVKEQITLTEAKEAEKKR